MRTALKVFKHIDWVVSIVLIAYHVYYWDSFGLRRAINAYLIVGGWHVLRMIVHAIWLPPLKHGTRYIYHRVSFIAVVTLPLGSYWILVIISPLMAVFYTILCITEAFSITNRLTHC